MDRDKLVSDEKVRVGPALLEVGRVLRRHALRLFVSALVVLLPLELLGAALTRNNPDVPRTGAPVGTDLVSGLVKLEPILGDLFVLLVAVPLLAGGVALLTASAQVERPTDAPTSLREGARRLPSSFAISVALGLAIAVVAAIAGLLDLVLPDVLPSGSIADVVAAVVLLLGLSVLLPFAVVGYPDAALRRAGPGDTLRTTVAIGRGAFVDLLGRGIVIIVLASALGTAARFVVMLVVTLLASGPFANAVGEAVADAVFIPVFAAGATLVYLDVRGRRGDIDREGLSRDLGRSTA